MSANLPKLCTIFGGSGFVGKHIVRALVKEGWRVRVATRSPHTEGDLRVIGRVGQVQIVQANLRFPDSVDAALKGADAVVNCVGILFEQGHQNFDDLHEHGAGNVAKAAAQAGISNFVQISAIGADSESESEYARTKAAGEAAIMAALPHADIMRPSIIFGPEDKFFNKFAAMSQYSPALPLLGGGETKFQPVYVVDVAKAVTKVLNAGTNGTIYELGGPRDYSFKELIQFTLDSVDRKRFLAPIPWFAANILGLKGELSGKLPFIAPFLTRDQVSLLRVDNVVADGAKGFADLKITPDAIEAIVPAYLTRFKKYGQFHQETIAE